MVWYDFLTLWPYQWWFFGTFFSVCLSLLTVSSSSAVVVTVCVVFTSLFVADLLVKSYEEFFYCRKYIEDCNSKAVLVTGCDSGFGVEDALRLADMGFLVYATVLSPDSAGAQRMMNHKNIDVVKLDVTDQTSVDNLCQYITGDLKKRKKTFWALVNNAGIGTYVDIEISPLEHIAHLMDINVFGVVRMCKAFVPLMRAAGGGRVVNMTSQASYFTVAATVPYSMTKHALMALTNGLRAELKLWNISVHCVSPGYYETWNSLEDHVKFLAHQFEKFFEKAPEEIKSATGLEYYKSRAKSAEKFSLSNVSPKEKIYEVIDDVVHAAAGVHPKTHYTPSVRMKVIHRLLGLLPQEVVDRVLAPPPPPSVKPNFLQHQPKTMGGLNPVPVRDQFHGGS